MKEHGFKILLVDDEPDFLSPLVKRLTRRNFQIEQANSGYHALEIIKNMDIDVVVLDVKMPLMSGLDVLRAIKSDYGMIEVIMLSGHASLEIAIEGIEHGAFDYLIKPLDFDELVFKLQDAYHKKVIQEQKIQNLEKRRDA